MRLKLSMSFYYQSSFYFLKVNGRYMQKQPYKQETFCIWLENQSKVESSTRLFFEFFLSIFEKSSETLINEFRVSGTLINFKKLLSRIIQNQFLISIGGNINNKWCNTYILLILGQGLKSHNIKQNVDLKIHSTLFCLPYVFCRLWQHKM